MLIVYNEIDFNQIFISMITPANTNPPRKFLFETMFHVRWGDMDAYGHVNNAVYFRYFEESRVRWLQSLAHDITTENERPVIVNANCTYYKPIVYPAELLIKLSADKPGNSSLVVFHELFLTNNPELIYAEAAIKIVWINYQTGKPTPLPERFRTLLVN